MTGKAFPCRPLAWIVYDCRRNLFVCERCGDRMNPVFPMRLDNLAKIADAWIKCHRKCKPSGESPMDAAERLCLEALSDGT